MAVGYISDFTSPHPDGVSTLRVMAQLTAEQESTFKNIRDHLKGFCGNTEFLDRLARENQWNAAFTQQVVDEYAKFLFLARESGHPVSPPPIIDKAWHLHLLHSDAYWNQLCPQILCMPLHHVPHTGNKAEDEKFKGWNRDTTASYQKFFGQPPALWNSVVWTKARVWYRNAGFLMLGFSLGCLVGISDGSDAWPLFIFAAIGFSIPAVIFFVSAISPLPPNARSDNGTSCASGMDSGDSGHSGHSCGSGCGGGHH